MKERVIDTLAAFKLLDRKAKPRTEDVEFATRKGSYERKLKEIKLGTELSLRQ